jgi:NNMT/PNMT/TEMT family
MTRTPTIPAADTSSVFFEFPARAYLEKYYNEVGIENSAFLRAITDYLGERDVNTDRVIEVAGGPSLFSTFAIAATRGRPFRQVTFTDIGWRNLGEVDSWLRDDPRQFDYEPLLDWLQAEVNADPATLVESLRRTPFDLINLDWRNEVPVGWLHAYDVVSSHFFAESATDDEQELLSLLNKVGRLGRPGAVFLLSFMCRSTGYRIAHQEFPAFDVDEHNVWSYLERAGVNLTDRVLKTVPTEDPASYPGYDGMLFIGGRLEH